jgi:murein DD-endopeptidase MepM/ murein hydrolase activator NlpD
MSARRWLTIGAATLLGCFVLVALYLRVDARTLAGIRVRSEPNAQSYQALVRSREPSVELRERARAWADATVELTLGAQRATATRRELGASLDADALAERAARLGHSGNPIADVWNAVEAWSFGVDLDWNARVDRAQLGRYVRALRNAVERPPVAGTSDGSGSALAGVDGVTLDTVASQSQLERMLRSGRRQLTLALRPVPAPTMAIGTPDGIDEGGPGPAHSASARLSDDDLRRMHAAAPKQWRAPQGCEPMDPPYEHFCQGPRQVPEPTGPAAELAGRLDLGSLQAVGHLLHAEPRSSWVSAAGGPRPSTHALQWPVNGGRLWRRFGYTRKPPFEALLHRGIDVGAPKGSPLMAADDGIVAYSDNRVRGYGNLLVIIHPDASVSFSAHCRAIYVFAGQRVTRGQIVGEVGDTGLARGAHVHWELHVKGQAIDPDGWFARH